MTLPVPQPGLVIGYSYLWAAEGRRGLDNGVKNRPCVIVAARSIFGGLKAVTVAPVTHSQPSDSAAGVEIPAAIKRHLSLDDSPSWIATTEVNDFTWPGVDLSPVPGSSPRRFDYGVLPARFYAHVRDLLLKAHSARRLERIPRTE